jgi:molybdopterin-containing oxidoreductase family membrane subunit
MWIKRFVIVVPPLQVPLMPFEFGNYTPTWIEWSITAASFAGFMLIFAIFVKLVPIVSVWEVAEEIQPEEAAQSEEALERRFLFAERRG